MSSSGQWKKLSQKLSLVSEPLKIIILIMSSFPSEQYDRLQMLIFWNKQSGGMHLNSTFVLTDILHGRRAPWDFSSYHAAVEYCISFMLLPQASS